MLRTLFLLAIVVPGLVAAVCSPYASLLVYFWYAFFRPDAWVWVDISSLRLSLVLGVVVLLRCAASGVVPNVTHPLSIGTVMFLVAALQAQMGAVNPAAGWFWIDYFTRLSLMCLLTVSVVTTPARMTYLLAVVGASYGFHTAKAGLASVLGGGLRFTNGTAGAFGDNNEYAIGAAMMIGLLVAAAQNLEYKWVRYGFYAAAVLTVFTIVSTFSRAGLIAMIVAIFAFVMLQRKRVGSLVSIAVVTLLAYAFVPVPEGYFDRMQTIQTYEEVDDKSALGRLHFWATALEMVRDQPLGVGLRNYEYAYDRYDTSDGYFGPRRAVHSSHFQVLAELGYPGTAVWIWLFGYAFVLALRIRSRSRNPALAPDQQRFLFTMANAIMTSMAAFLVGGSFISLAVNELTWLTFAVLAALDRLSHQMLATEAFPLLAAPVPQFNRSNVRHDFAGIQGTR